MKFLHDFQKLIREIARTTNDHLPAKGTANQLSARRFYEFDGHENWSWWTGTIPADNAIHGLQLINVLASRMGRKRTTSSRPRYKFKTTKDDLQGTDLKGKNLQVGQKYHSRSNNTGIYLRSLGIKEPQGLANSRSCCHKNC